ncbi:MAG: filamentous hemagglutinin N-terminal domain-containing protein [Pseudomonadota bacterium]
MLQIFSSRSFRQSGLAILCSVLLSTGASANPTGHQVVAGSAQIESTGNVMSITNAPGTIINWDAFSIAAGELTQFNQINAASSVLNRVTGLDMSTILGELQSNGRVFLINPNGILVGAGAVIDTAGFVASSLDISNQDFLDGKLQFQGDGGAVVNRGLITVGKGGEVVLLAPTVENSGVIRADDGAVLLAAGREVLITSLDSENISFKVQAPGDSALNLGSLLASHGSISVFADHVVNKGQVSANAVSRASDGSIVLHGEVSTEVSGTLTAAGQKGGTIEILGKTIDIANANIDASGASGGGNINIGGDFQGNGPLPEADVTIIDGNTRISNDALEAGSGGNTIIWSEKETIVEAKLSARGGPGGGDGGLVETSSKGNLQFSQSVDVTAPSGAPGTWLIDPEDITIRSGEANAISSTLNQGGSVTVQTSDSGSGEGNITVAAPITKTEGGDASLAMVAHTGIYVNAPITSTAGKLSVGLRAGKKISVNAPIVTNGGSYSAVINPSLLPDDPEEEEDVIDAESDEAEQVAQQGAESETSPADETGDGDTSVAQESDSTAETVTELADDPSTSPDIADAENAVEVVDVVIETDEGPVAFVGGGVPDTESSHAVVPETGIHFTEDVTTGGGDISVDAGADGTAVVDANIDSSDTTSGGTGGDIELLGFQIGIVNDSVVDASGDTGAGEILIGGDQQGQNPEVRNAENIYTSADSIVRSDTLGSGDGGRVILFAENTANIHGSISARGGENSGNGGFVETSGLNNLTVSQTPDVTSGNGESGTWLIDPHDITIDNFPMTDTDISESTVDDTDIFESNADGAFLSIDSIHAALHSGADVVIQTGANGSESGNISWNGFLDLDCRNIDGCLQGPDPAGSLTLSAHNDVRFSGAIIDSGANFNMVDSRITELNLIADSDSNSRGSVVISSNNGFNFGGVQIDVAGDINISGESLEISAAFDGETGGDVLINADGSIVAMLDGDESTANGGRTLIETFDAAVSITANENIEFSGLGDFTAQTSASVPQTFGVDTDASITIDSTSTLADRGVVINQGSNGSINLNADASAVDLIDGGEADGSIRIDSATDIEIIGEGVFARTNFGSTVSVNASDQIDITAMGTGDDGEIRLDAFIDDIDVTAGGNLNISGNSNFIATTEDDFTYMNAPQVFIQSGSNTNINLGGIGDLEFTAGETGGSIRMQTPELSIQAVQDVRLTGGGSEFDASRASVRVEANQIDADISGELVLTGGNGNESDASISRINPFFPPGELDTTVFDFSVGGNTQLVAGGDGSYAAIGRGVRVENFFNQPVDRLYLTTGGNLTIIGGNYNEVESDLGSDAGLMSREMMMVGADDIRLVGGNGNLTDAFISIELFRSLFEGDASIVQNEAVKGPVDIVDITQPTEISQTVTSNTNITLIGGNGNSSTATILASIVDESFGLTADNLPDLFATQLVSAGGNIVLDASQAPGDNAGVAIGLEVLNDTTPAGTGANINAGANSTQTILAGQSTGDGEISLLSGNETAGLGTSARIYTDIDFIYERASQTIRTNRLNIVEGFAEDAPAEIVQDFGRPNSNTSQNIFADELNFQGGRISGLGSIIVEDLYWSEGSFDGAGVLVTTGTDSEIGADIAGNDIDDVLGSRGQPDRSRQLSNRTWRQEGDIEWLGGDIEFDSVTLENSGSFSITDDHQIFAFNESEGEFPESTIENMDGGVFTKIDGEGISTIGSSIFFSNQGGDVIASSGEMAFDGGFEQLDGTTELTSDPTIDVEDFFVISSTSNMDFQGGQISGSGTIDATVDLDGVLVTPGQSPGNLNITGDMNASSNTNFFMEIEGFDPGFDHDFISVGGNANLAGTMEVFLDGGFIPDDGDTFNLIKAAGDVNGVFDVFIADDIELTPESRLIPNEEYLATDYNVFYFLDEDDPVDPPPPPPPPVDPPPVDPPMPPAEPVEPGPPPPPPVAPVMQDPPMPGTGQPLVFTPPEPDDPLPPGPRVDDLVLVLLDQMPNNEPFPYDRPEFLQCR